MECWYFIYKGLPNRVLADQGSELCEKFVNFGNLSKMNVYRNNVESHTSLDVGESYKNPFRNYY